MEAYHQLYKKNAKSLLARKSVSVTWDYKNETVFTTWEISFAAVLEESPKAARLLLLCGFLAKDDIWEELLRHGFGLKEDGKNLNGNRLINKHIRLTRKCKTFS